MLVVPPLIRFGVFELDLGTGELSKSGRKLKLQEQPFRLLRLLLEHSGQAVSRDKLKEALWPADTFVDFDHSLNAATAKLRQALGDSAENPRFIETLARRGYRFIAPVEFIERASSGVAGVLGTNSSAPIPPEKKDSFPIATSGMPTSRRRKRVALLAGCTGALLLVALSVWIWRTGHLAETELIKLTDDTGFTTDPAISVDGKLLAYASDRGSNGNLNIWLQQLGPGGTAVQLTHRNADATEPAFSPDNDLIAFGSNGHDGGIYTVPVIGGEPSRLTQSGRSPHFSPDGHWIAYCSDCSEAPFPSGLEGGRIFVVPANGGEPRGVGLDLPSAANPVWSPEGNHLLVYVPPKERFAWEGADWWLIALDATASKRTGIFSALKRQGFSIGLGRIPRLSQPNRNFVTFAAGFGDAINWWRMPISADGHSTGPAERLTSGTTLEVSPALTSTGDLVFASLNRNTAIWSVQANSDQARITGEFKRITEGPAELMPSISADGRWLAFTAAHRQSGSSRKPVPFSDQSAAELHARIRDLSTGEETAISNSEPVQWHPQISRDGSMVAYTVGKPGSVYAAAVNGGVARLLVGGRNFFAWDWSRDNRTLLFNGNNQQVHSADLPSGAAKLFLTRPGFGLYQAKFSPDDRSVAVVGCHDDVRATGECQIFVVPTENGAAAPFKNWIALDHPSNWDDKPRWSPSGSILYFISDRDGYACIWGQRIEIGTRRLLGSPFAVYHFHKSRLALLNLGFSLTEIGVAKNQIAIGLQELTGNIWSLRRK